MWYNNIVIKREPELKQILEKEGSFIMDKLSTVVIAVAIFISVIAFQYVLYGCFIGLIYWLLTLLFDIPFVWKYLFIITGIFTLLAMLFRKPTKNDNN